MKQVNWAPISKTLVADLPEDRPFTQFKAMFSLAVSYDCGASVSVSGLASKWGWSRNRVRTFLKRYGISIAYDGQPNGHGGGQLVYQQGYQQRDSKGTAKGQQGDSKGTTITEPEPKPKPKKKKYGSFSNVLLTDDEHEKLLEKFVEKGREDWVEQRLFPHRQQRRSVQKPLSHHPELAQDEGW